MSRKPQTFSMVQNLRERYYTSSKGKEGLLKILAEVEIPEQVFNSNAIENSTLSLEETEKILLKIDLDRYISDREIFEAKNLARVVEYIDTKAHEKDLTLEVILLLHKMLLSNIRDDIAGRFRKGNENVRVGIHIGASPTDIVNLMETMMITYKSSIHESIIERIAKLHLTFEHIHPFGDGNGRIGRVIINYLLIREGYVPINIKFIDRAKYYDAFKQFDQSGETHIMQEIVGRALTNSYHKRLAYLEDKKILTLDEYSKITHQSYANALNKARRQTIPAFLERGIWKVGVDRS